MSRTKRKDYYNNNLVNDQKPFYKPNKKFKQTLKRRRKAKERKAMNHILDNEDVVVPEFPNQDTYLWN